MWCLDNVSLVESRVLKSPTIIVLSIFPLITGSICLRYLGMPMFGAYINGCFIFLLILLLYYVIIFFVPYHFGLKSILYDMTLAIPTFY